MWAIFSWLLTLTYFLVALTVLLYMLSSAIPLAGFFARLIASYFALLISATFGVTVSILLRLVGYGRISQWATARCFKYVMLYFTGVTFKVEDPHNYLGTTRPAVFIGNHQSELDVLMLGCIFPQYCSVTAKSSLKNIPFLGWFMALSGSIFIDRKNHQSARDAMKGAAAEMKRERQSVYMFPEGTRSYYTEAGLLPFKKGAFHLAVEGHVPIVPVVVANYSNILNVKSWTFTGGEILVKVMQPIDTAALGPADVEDLTRSTREAMLQELVTLTERSKASSVAAPRQQTKKLA